MAILLRDAVYRFIRSSLVLVDVLSNGILTAGPSFTITPEIKMIGMEVSKGEGRDGAPMAQRRSLIQNAGCELERIDDIKKRTMSKPVQNSAKEMAIAVFMKRGLRVSVQVRYRDKRAWKSSTRRDYAVLEQAVARAGNGGLKGEEVVVPGVDWLRNVSNYFLKTPFANVRICRHFLSANLAV